MAVNIVTGMVGDDHITSHDDRARHASQFGRGKYVFPVGERFSAEKISENLVRIKDGMCINQGTQMGIEPNDYTDVEIDNGITGLEGDIDSLGGRMNTAESGIDTFETNQTQILSDIDAFEHSLSTAGTVLLLK